MVFQRKSKKRMIRKKMSRKNIYRGGSDNETDALVAMNANEKIIDITLELMEDTKLMNSGQEAFIAELRNTIKETRDSITEEACGGLGDSAAIVTRSLYNDMFPMFVKDSNSRGGLPRNPNELYKHMERLMSIADGNDDKTFSNDEKKQEYYQSLLERILLHVVEQSGWPQNKDEITQEWAELATQGFNSFSEEYDSHSKSKQIDYALFACKNIKAISKYWDNVLAASDDELATHAQLLLETKQAQLKGGNRRRRISRRSRRRPNFNFFSFRKAPAETPAPAVIKAPEVFLGEFEKCNDYIECLNSGQRIDNCSSGLNSRLPEKSPTLAFNKACRQYVTYDSKGNTSGKEAMRNYLETLSCDPKCNEYLWKNTYNN